MQHAASQIHRPYISFAKGRIVVCEAFSTSFLPQQYTFLLSYGLHLQQGRVHFFNFFLNKKRRKKFERIKKTLERRKHRFGVNL